MKVYYYEFRDRKSSERIIPFGVTPTGYTVPVGKIFKIIGTKKIENGTEYLLDDTYGKLKLLRIKTAFGKATQYHSIEIDTGGSSLVEVSIGDKIAFSGNIIRYEANSSDWKVTPIDIKAQKRIKILK